MYNIYLYDIIKYYTSNKYLWVIIIRNRWIKRQKCRQIVDNELNINARRNAPKRKAFLFFNFGQFFCINAPLVHCATEDDKTACRVRLCDECGSSVGGKL